LGGGEGGWQASKVAELYVMIEGGTCRKFKVLCSCYSKMGPQEYRQHPSGSMHPAGRTIQRVFHCAYRRLIPGSQFLAVLCYHAQKCIEAMEPGTPSLLCLSFQWFATRESLITTAGLSWKRLGGSIPSRYSALAAFHDKSPVGIGKWVVCPLRVDVACG
jgi:hypothetical protein